MNTGTFTISIDFELYWGMRDTRSLDALRDRLDGVEQAIPAMLNLFEQHRIHATWATVGLIFGAVRIEYGSTHAAMAKASSDAV